MTDSPDKLHKGTIILPERDAHRDTGRPMIVSAFARIRNEILQKELASLAAKARTWNEFVEALRDGERLKQDYMTALVRSENLDQLRLGEEAKILAEVQEIFDEAAARQKQHKLRDLRLDAEIERAQRELDALRRPTGDKPEESRTKKRVAAIKRIREERDEMIEIIKAGRPNDQLGEEDTRLIDDMRLAADNEIKNMLEEGPD
jgi:hypothetical protein